MTSALCLLTSEDLSQLAGALRSGRIAPPFSPLVLRRYVSESMAAPVAIELQQRVAGGRNHGTWQTASKCSARIAGTARLPRT